MVLINRPYTVLAEYRPQVWNANRIAADLLHITRSHGLKPHVDPQHGPLTKVAWVSLYNHAELRRRSFKTKMAEDWHYDGDTTPGSKPDCQLVLWASNNPTLIKRRHGQDTTVYQPRPYEVVVFHNTVCLHRRPPGVPKIRWVFRQRCAL